MSWKDFVVVGGGGFNMLAFPSCLLPTGEPKYHPPPLHSPTPTHPKPHRTSSQSLWLRSLGQRQTELLQWRISKRKINMSTLHRCFSWCLNVHLGFLLKLMQRHRFQREERKLGWYKKKNKNTKEVSKVWRKKMQVVGMYADLHSHPQIKVLL